MIRVRGLALVLAAGIAMTAVPGYAEPARQTPQGPAAVKFGAGFPKLKDSEWGFALGGFGGVKPRAKLRHIPVIFIHGNNVDAADWYPVRDDFRAAGWSDQELYGLSYNGLGSQNGTALFRANPERDAEHMAMNDSDIPRVTENSVNVADVYAFIKAVRAYTGQPRFTLVSHSLGVTLARETLRQHPELRRDLAAFVGIAGGNHGTSFCPPGSEGQVVSCNEIAAGTAWLARLNGAGGRDETFGRTRWMTIRDGSGVGDPAYLGPTYADSPILRGALNLAYPYSYHNDLRIQASIVQDYRRFIEASK